MGFIPMFHVEHMAKLAQILILIQLLIACNKPPTDPQIGDFIYTDLNSQQQLTAGKIAAQEKAIVSIQKSLSESRPQTGQFLIWKNKLAAAEDVLYKLKQQDRYWTIRIAERVRVLKVRELKKFYAKVEPITEQEEKSYRIEKTLRLAKLKWDAKERIEQNELSRKPAAASAETAAAPGGH